MRISFILSSLWLSGGVRDIVEYANRLAERGHTIALVIPGGTNDRDMASELHHAVQCIESEAPRLNDASVFHQARLSWSMARAVPHSDLIISTHTPTTVPGFLSTRLLRKGIPVWFYQDYLDMFRGRRLEQWLLRNAVRWHRLTLTISQYAADELSTYSPGNIEVAHIGLSHAEVFQPVLMSERPVAPERRILFLGDMRPRKGLYDFLEAMAIVHAQIPNIRLWIVSKEDCDIQSELPFEYIHRPSRQELARLYNACDVFVSASWWESLGIPALEAMASAAPVVLTQSGGVLDYARPGENCLMTPARDPEALAAAVLRVLGDPALAQQLSVNGPPTAAEFDWDKVTDNLERRLHELLA